MSRKTRTWRNPATITPQNAPFGIDEEIQTLWKARDKKNSRMVRLQLYWSSIDDAISFGRRALQVALEDAIELEGRRANAEFYQWGHTAKLTETAHAALQKLLEYIGPSGLPSTYLPPVRVGGLTKSGKISVKIVSRLKPGGKLFTDEDYRNEIEVLSKARDTLKEIVDHANERRRGLDYTKKIRGDYGKQAFVYRLAQGWIFLTGKKPGRGRIPDRNPFLRFVESALADAGREDIRDAFRTQEQVLQMLERVSSDLGSTKNHESISGIAAYGPAWA